MYGYLNGYLREEDVAMATRSKGDGSIYQRGDGRWVGTIEVGWVGGKRKRRKVTGDRRAEVVTKLSRLRKQVDEGVLPETIRVEQWMSHFLVTVCRDKGLKAGTIERYRGWVDRWIVPQLGKTQLQRLTTEQVRAMYAAMREAGLSDGSVRQVHAILRRALNVAVREQRLLRNPAAAIELSTRKAVPHAALTDVQAMRVIEAATSARMRARLVVALVLGLRQGEALGLRWTDVDLERGVLDVHEAASFRGGKLVLDTPKTASSVRLIPLPGGVVEVLRAWREEAGGRSEWVFPGRDGSRPIHSGADWQHWKRALEVAGVPHVPLHGARGSAASILDAMGVPLRVIADILGHATITVTRDHYLHSSEVQRSEAMALLSGRLQLEP